MDREGNRFEPGLTLQNRFRVGMNYDSGLQWDFLVFKLAYEHEWQSGMVMEGDNALEGEFFPGDEGVTENQLRKAFAQVSLGYFLTAGWGITTSNWGLGMLANDGSRSGLREAHTLERRKVGTWFGGA